MVVRVDLGHTTRRMTNFDARMNCREDEDKRCSVMLPKTVSSTGKHDTRACLADVNGSKIFLIVMSSISLVLKLMDVRMAEKLLLRLSLIVSEQSVSSSASSSSSFSAEE